MWYLECMTFAEFHANWAINVDRALGLDLRAGQFAMNLLRRDRPDLYSFVSGWYCVDPFYRDEFRASLLAGGRSEMVKVLAFDETVVYDARMSTTQTLQEEAVAAIAGAEFRDAWPIDVRKTLVKAVRTEGEMPAYAVREVRNALRDARRIEQKCRKDIEAGEKLLSHAEKRRRAQLTEVK